MGMFDYIEFECEIPEPARKCYPEGWQTKDLRNMMDVYVVKNDGALFRKKTKYVAAPERKLFPYQAVPDGEEEVVDYHGDIFVIGSPSSESNEFIEMRVRFTHGKLEEIKLMGE
jgi:hypothetical protein